MPYTDLVHYEDYIHSKELIKSWVLDRNVRLLQEVAFTTG